MNNGGNVIDDVFFFSYRIIICQINVKSIIHEKFLLGDAMKTIKLEDFW